MQDDIVTGIPNSFCAWSWFLSVEDFFVNYSFIHGTVFTILVIAKCSRVKETGEEVLG
jgi:hypothetical protein